MGLRLTNQQALNSLKSRITKEVKATNYIFLMPESVDATIFITD